MGSSASSRRKREPTLQAPCTQELLAQSMGQPCTTAPLYPVPQAPTAPWSLDVVLTACTCVHFSIVMPSSWPYLPCVFQTYPWALAAFCTSPLVTLLPMRFQDTNVVFTLSLFLGKEQHPLLAATSGGLGIIPLSALDTPSISLHSSSSTASTRPQSGILLLLMLPYSSLTQLSHSFFWLPSLLWCL